jgi:hypothetical protein
MSDFGKGLLRYVISIVAGVLVYAAIGILLEMLSKQFESETAIGDAVQTTLSFMSPLSYGLVVLAVLVGISFWVLPKWIPRLRLSNEAPK